MDQERIDDSRRFGIWPAFVGVLIAAGITWLMFHLATGFL